MGRVNSGDVSPEVVERSIESFEKRLVIRGKLCGGGAQSRSHASWTPSGLVQRTLGVVSG